MEEAWIDSLEYFMVPKNGLGRAANIEEIGRGECQLSGDSCSLGCNVVARCGPTFENAFRFLKEIPWS